MKKGRVVVFCLWWLVTCSVDRGEVIASTSEPRSTRALVTQLDGVASVELPDSRTVVPVRAQEVLSLRADLHVTPGARIGVVCDADRWLVLENPEDTKQSKELELTAQACARGKPLHKGTFESLLPRAAFVRNNILEQITRGDEDDPLTPLLLAPRETKVTQAKPEIRWTRVGDAVEYEIELSGSEPWMRRYAVEDLPCPGQTFLGKRYEICSVPWPDDVPELEPGEPVFLSVGARSGFAAPLRKAKPSRLVRLPEDEVEETQRMRWTLLQTLSSGAEDRRLESRLYRHRGLHQRAATVFEGLGTSDLGVEDRLEAAELALEIDLPERARDLARKAFGDATALDLQARALELEALADVLQQRTRQARETLGRALTLYRRAKLTESASAVESTLRKLEGK